MIRPAGVVAGAGVLPVVEDDVAGLGCVGVAFHPLAELLEKGDHLAASALGRDDARQAALDGDGGDEGGAPCVRVPDRVPSGERLVGVVGVDDRLVAPVGFLPAEPSSGAGDDLVPLGASGRGGRGLLRVPVVSASLDDGRVVDISVVQIDVSGDAVDSARGGVLPDAVLAGVGALACVLRHPVREGCELGVVHALPESGYRRAVDADEVTGGLHRLAEGDRGLRDTGLGGGGLRLVVHVDRVFQLLALKYPDESLRVRLARSSAHAVLPDEVVCADGDTGCLRALVVRLPLAVRVGARVGASGLDDSELDARCLHLVPVDVSLPAGDVDSSVLAMLFSLLALAVVELLQDLLQLLRYR